MSESYDLILKKIREFIRKFYLFQLLRGIIIFISIFLFIYLIIILLQYFFYFDVFIKTVIFYGFVFIALLGFVDFIFIPFLKIFGITKTIDFKEAANYISNRFPEIKDQLLNILELAEQFPHSDIALASIEQKTRNVKLFDFSEAVNFAQLGRYAKYLIFPLIVFLYLLFFNSSILDEGTKRFLAYNKYIAPKPPFSFQLLNKNLTVKKGGDFTLKVKVDGKYIPEEVYLNYGGNRFVLIKEKGHKNIFTYTFENVNKSFDFYLQADKYKSEFFHLKVLPIPLVADFSVKVIPPKYTNISQKILKNTGDIVVPYGSRLIWKFKTIDVDTLIFMLDTTKLFARKLKDAFIVEYMIRHSGTYKVVASNQFFSRQNIFKFNVIVIPDLPPSINVAILPDSANITSYYFRGLISDDYGFTSLTFHYGVFDKNSHSIDFSKFKSINIPFVPALLHQNFYYYFDFSKFVNLKGKVVKYYFQVADNDVISGFKKTMTDIFEFHIYSTFELDSILDTLDNDVSDKLSAAEQLASSIREDINEYQQKLLQENMSEWEKQDFLNRILSKQQQLQQLLETLKKENQQKLNNLKTFSQNKDLIEKQKKLQQFLDSLMTDEIKDLLKKLEQLQKQFNSQQFDKLMQKMQMPYEDLSKRMNRNLNLLKRLKIEQDIKNTAQQLKDIAHQLDSLRSEINSKKNADSAKNSLNSLENRFKQLQEKYNKALKLNEELSKPYNLQDFKQEFQNINNNFSQINDKLQQQKNRQANKLMKNTSQDIQNLAQKMEQMMTQNMQAAAMEDISSLKRLFESVLEFSFAQESLYTVGKSIRLYTPSYNRVKRQQFFLKEKFKIIEDSLYSLAERNPIISTFVMSEVSSIKRNLNSAIEFFEKNNRSQARFFQRKVFISMNKLALFLEESIQNLQNQMQGSGSGNPQQQPSASPSLSDLQQLQQALQQQLQKMLQQMQQQQGKNNSKQMQQMAEQIANREMFDKMLRDFMNNNTLSPQESKILNQIKQDNDQIKSDIINNRLTTQTLLRQQQIMVRLLEAEKADMTRKFSNKRIAQKGADSLYRNPAQIEKYFKKYHKSIELINYNPIELNRFYKHYFNFYLNQISKKQ